MSQAIEAVRMHEDLPDTLTLLYVVDETDVAQVSGIVTLRDLLLAGPVKRVDEIMTTTFHHVPPDASVEQVVRTIIEYNLLEIPVLDEHGTLLGVVTVDDAAERLLPAGWRDETANVFS